MPRGVAKEFLEILGSEERAARFRFWVLAATALLLFLPAWFIIPPWGPATHAAALIVGLLLGLLAAHRLARAREESIRGSWNRWMEYAFASHTVTDIHRRVRGRAQRDRAALMAAVLTAVWALETLLFTLALMGETSIAWGHVVVALNGLLVGALAGHFLRTRNWSRAFRASLKDMLAQGEIGVWGVR